ncbi:MAG: hypothetical protein V2A69_13940 [Pseudomonadota bacterium]
MMKKYTVMVLVGVSILFFAGAVMGQPEYCQKRWLMDDAASKKDFHERLCQNRERIQMLRMWGLIRELNLDEARAAKLFPALNRYDQKRWEVVQEERQLLGDLRQALKNEKPDEKKIKELIDNLGTNAAARENLQKEELQELKKILSLPELGHYILFQHQFVGEIQDIIRNVKKNRFHRPDTQAPGEQNESTQ